ncbi:hypothetical protein AB1E18_016502 [Capra hircus]
MWLSVIAAQEPRSMQAPAAVVRSLSRVVCTGEESFALDSQNEVYRLDDFWRKFAPLCSSCENPSIPQDGKDAFKIEYVGGNFRRVAPGVRTAGSFRLWSPRARGATR